MAPTLDQLLKALADRNHAEWENGPAPPSLSISISRIYTACKKGDFTPEEVRLIAENPATARAVASCFAVMDESPSNPIQYRL